jgi:hypothetical protein
MAGSRGQGPTPSCARGHDGGDEQMFGAGNKSPHPAKATIAITRTLNFVGMQFVDYGDNPRARPVLMGRAD